MASAVSVSIIGSHLQSSDAIAIANNGQCDLRDRPHE